MMDTRGLFSSLFKERIPTEDEYLNNEDGLIYCRKCNTPRQAKIMPNGSPIPFFPPIMCQCQRQQYEREEQERLQRQFDDEVSKMRTSGLQDRALYTYTFSNDRGYTPQINIAKRYVEHFDEMEENGTGLLFWGQVGSGKTFLAGCIANALLDKRIPVLMTNFSRVLNRLSSKVTDDWNALLDSFDRYRLLIIDDLGVERNSEFAMEQIFNVVDARCQSKRPMIITTNLTLHSMKEAQDLAHARIYDRILEHCLPVCVTGDKIRKRIATENMAALRSVLGD